VHVAAADAGEFDVYDYIVGVGERGDGAVFEGYGVGFLEDEGEVLCGGWGC